MGCIVNGPGEMADADFGYVGGSPGKIDLYVGKVKQLSSLKTLMGLIKIYKYVIIEKNYALKDLQFPKELRLHKNLKFVKRRDFKLEFVTQTVVKRGIVMEQATDALIQLIKDHGRWVDPPADE